MNINPFTTVSIVDTSWGGAKTLNLPYSILVLNKTITIKDKGGRAADSNITILTHSNDSFQDGSSNYIINTNYGSVSFLALSNTWCLIGAAEANNNEIRLLSSIISYGLSTVATQPHDSISSLSSIVSYGLSTVWNDLVLSNTITYGDLLNLSSIVSYGLSSIQTQTVIADAVFYNSNIINYYEPVINSNVIYNSNILNYYNYYYDAINNPTISYCNTTVNNFIFSNDSLTGISSLSSIVSYGLSTVAAGAGISSLSSIVSYGLSTVAAGAINDGVSSLSSIVSYGLSTVAAGTGISSLSSIVSYGLSTVAAGAINDGVSSLSSIVSYGLSTVAAGAINDGVSSLSSIVSYGLSTVAAGARNPGVSSLSSIVSYGLSTVAAGAINPGVSSLSSIISYGLSTVAAGAINPGVSSLSSIVSYGLSTVYSPYGVSSLSSIISYGLSTVYSNLDIRITALELSNNYLKNNTWVTPFRPSTIGGTDIYDLSTGNPDTYTNALAKIDAWIYKNLIDQPPPPTYNIQRNSISSVSFFWKKPDQFKIGILDVYSPYISSIHFELYSNIAPNSISSNLFSTFVFGDGLVPFNRFQVEGVEFTNAESSLFQFNNETNTVRIGINAIEFNYNNGPYNLNMYFKNYSSNIYSTLLFNPQNMGLVSPPSAPQSIIFTNITTRSAKIIIQKPQYNDSNLLTETYPELQDYTAILSNIAIPRRRYQDSFAAGEVFEYTSITYNSNFQEFSLGDNILFPDITYFLTISARNIVNQNFGDKFTSSNFRAALPTPPGSITSITNFPNNNSFLYNFTGENIFPIGGATKLSNLQIYNKNLFGNNEEPLSFYTNSNLGIHSALNSGSTSNNICSFTIITNENVSNSIQIGGFATSYIPVSNSGTTSIILASNIIDFYPLDDTVNTKFYLIFTGYIYLKNTFLTARANPHSFSLRHSNSFHINTCNGPQIRVDNINTPPSIQSIIIPTATSFRYISGVPIYSYNNTLTLGFIINNLASNFYISGQNLIRGSLSFGGANFGTPFVANTSVQLLNPNGTTISSTPIPFQSRIDIPGNTFNNTALYTPANNGGARVTTQLILSNLAGSATPTIAVPAYFDAKSEILIDTILNSALNGTGGLHMLSDGGNTANIPSGAYIHDQHIKLNGSLNYNEELPIVNGLFRTSANIGNAYTSFSEFTQINGAYNYPDYSFIDNEVDGSGYIRYATFKYTFTNTTTSNIHKIQFNLSNLTGLQCNASINPYNTSIVPYLAYRIDNIEGYNTPWLDGNTTRTNINAFTSAVTNLTRGVRSNNLTYAPITNSSRFFSIIPIPPNCNFDIYVKIGLQMQESISFQNIFMVPYFGILPSVTQNITLFLQSSNLNLTWSIPATYSEPLINYIISIIPSCNAVSPRRYVANGSRISQEAYFLSNTLAPQVLSYSNVFDNYDTPYTGYVALENDVGIGVFGVSASVVQTPLPSVQYPIFSSTTASNLDLNAAYKNYFPFCNAYNFRDIKAAGSGNIITNILLPQNVVYFDWLHNETTSNIFTINDSSTPGQGLTNFFYTARQIDNANNSVVATTTYTFTNNLYINSNTEITVTSSANETLQVNITRLRDTYSNGSRTGFYMRAYPNILLGSLSGTDRSLYYQLLNNTTTLTTTVFNVDSVISGNATPVVTNIITSASELTTNSATYSNYVCGVLIFTSSAPYNQWIQVDNLGRNYVRSNAVAVSLQSNSSVSLCNFPFNAITTPFYLAQGGAIYTDAPIRNTTFFNWPIQLSYPIYTPCNAPSFVGNACNLHGTGPQSNFRLVGDAQKEIFFDTPSITVRNATLQSNFTIGGINYGARVESGNGTNPAIGEFGANFNDSQSLLGAYSNEIQLTNGSYRTYSNAKFGGRSNGYLDYRDYYNPYGGAVYADYDTVTKTGMRYLTLKWSFSAGTNDWRSATINFTFTDSNSMFPFDPVSLVFNGITIQMRIIASNDQSASPTNYTTAWLNANAITSIPPNSTTKNDTGRPIGFNYAGAPADTCNVRIFYPILSGSYSNINHSVYIRIGFPMNSNISLQYITYTPTIASSIPQSVTDLSISNSIISAIPLCNSIIRWNRQMDGINIQSFIGTYGARTNTVGGITYPRRFGGTIISDNNEFNVPGVDGQQLYNNLFIPQNYDTYYFATIIASNISGKSPITSNISINSTALPPLIGDSFIGVLRTNVVVNYSRDAILFSSRDSPIVSSNLIYNSNNIMPSGTSEQFGIYSSSNIGVAQSRIIVNSNTNAIGNISNIVWNVSLFRNNSLVIGANYTFSNQSFGRSNNNIDVINNGAIYWGFNYIRDMYLGSGTTSTSNFYIIAQPFIVFNSVHVRAGSSNYRLTITNSNDNLSNSVNFFIDNINIAPSGRIFVENIGTISYCNICGVPVITSNTFNFWIQTSNIGRHFFVPQPISASLTSGGSFSFNNETTPFYSSSNTGSSYISGPISNVTFFYWSNVTLTTTSFGSTYTLNGAITNLIGSAVLNNGTGFRPYYDPLSIIALGCNVRVESGGNSATPAVGTFGGLFDNNNTGIYSGSPIYIHELQLVNGAYRTLGTGAYSDYSTFLIPSGATNPGDYSGVDTNVIRYVTFVFSNINPINSSNKIDRVSIKITYDTTSPGIMPSTDGTRYTNITFQIRINSNTATSINNSSGWLNANTSLVGTNIGVAIKQNDGTGCLIGSISRTSPDDTINIQIPDGCGYSNMNLYTRVGFNMANRYALKTINLLTQTPINIPNQFNATLYVNCNSGARQQFNINLLPCLPIATYCNLETSFSNTRLNSVFMGETAITHLSNYSFTGNTQYTNISNLWMYGTFIIKRNNGTIFYTSNLIQSMDYYVARPMSAIISFSNAAGGPGVWNSPNNYLALSISNIANLTNGRIFYTFSNDTRTINITSSCNIIKDVAGTLIITNNLTSEQYLNRAFYVSCFTRAEMQITSETRDSETLIGGSNGIFSPPSGFSIVTFGSNSTGVSTYSYTSQFFTFHIISATYSNYTYSAGGFPRRVGGYIAGVIDSASNTPIFPISRTSPFNVYDTNYYATLFLTYSNGGSCNTDPVTVTSRTELPSNRRNRWQGNLVFSGTAYPNLGYGGPGVGAVNVHIAGFASNSFNSNFIAINSSPGSVDGCNFTISDQAGSYSYSFVNSGYNYLTGNKSNISLISGNRSGTLSIYDGVSGFVSPPRLNDTGFWMAFDLQYRYTYSASPVGIPTTISLNGSNITNTVYVDNDPGQIGLGTFSPDYSIQPGNTPVNNNLGGSTAISVRSIPDVNSLPILNVLENIRPFNFGRILLTYTSGGITTTTNNSYTWLHATSKNINLPITLFGSIPINTITTYNMAVSFSNIKTSVSSNIIDRIFNDSTFSSANQAITASNPGFENPTPKWIHGAWRTDMTALPFTLSEIRSTYGNANFQIGPGFIIYTVPVRPNAPDVRFNIRTNVPNIGFTSITAYYPPAVQQVGQPTPTYGTFDCLVNDGGIDSLRIDGGCLKNNPLSNNYLIYCPFQYKGGSVSITISLGANQNISNISSN